MSDYNLIHIATVAVELLTNAGYLDDLDELVADKLTNVRNGTMSIDDLFEWSYGIDETVRLIKDQLGRELNIDCLGEINNQLMVILSNPILDELRESMPS